MIITCLHRSHIPFWPRSPFRVEIMTRNFCAWRLTGRRMLVVTLRDSLRDIFTALTENPARRSTTDTTMDWNAPVSVSGDQPTTQRQNPDVPELGLR